MEYISKEDMIIEQLHLNSKGVLDLVKSMKEVTDEAESSMELHEIIDNQVSKLKSLILSKYIQMSLDA